MRTLSHALFCLMVATAFLAVFSPSAFANQVVSYYSLSAQQRPMTSLDKSAAVKGGKVVLPAMNITQLKNQADSVKPGTGAYEFAQAITDKSLWEQQTGWETNGDISVYRIAFTSNDAVSLNIGLNNVFLPKGAQLFFLTPDGEKIARFDHLDNKSHKQLWSPVFEGNELVLEVNTPSHLVKQTRFEIAQVAQGFRKIDSASLKSGDCNINVVCPEGDAWRDEIRSVARIVIGGIGLCTGSLVNNVEEDDTPYFLSANHCGITASSAPTITFYWNFETSQCDMNTLEADGTLDQFQTGSIFRAAHAASDMALVELDSRPDAEFNVHFAGWNNSALAPTSAVAIHHPAGDEKRISFDSDPLTIVNGIQSDAPVTDGTHLKVGEWELGTTEGGSSGSAIWDENQFIVGTLHGGFASCSATDEADWYGRLAAQWEGGGTSSTQLKAWLDPQDTGAQTLTGSDGCDAPNAMIEIDEASPVFGSTINLTAGASGGTGSNYSFEWDVNSDGVIDAQGAEVAVTYDYFFEGNVRLYVSDESNCTGVQTSAVNVLFPDEEVFAVNNDIPENWAATAASDAPWASTSTQTYEGGFALQSGNVADNESSEIETTYNFDSAEGNFIAFAARVSSEVGFDFFKFYIDNQEMASLSGEQDWTTFYFNVTPGSHTLRWAFEKDFSVSNGSDAAWIDGVTGIDVTSSTDDGGDDSGGDDGGDNSGGGDAGSDSDSDDGNDDVVDDTPTDSSGSSGGALNGFVLLFLTVSLFVTRRRTIDV